MTSLEAPAVRRPPVLVLVARIVLLLMALALVAAGALVAWRDGAPARARDGYSCPMHPEVVSAGTGECPICHMALEPRGGRAHVGQRHEHESSAPVPSAASGYVCPMHPEVTAAEPGKCRICKMSLVPAKQKPPAPAPKTIPAAARASPLGVTWLPATFPPAAAANPADRPALAAPERQTFTDAARAPAWVEETGRVAALLYRDELVGLATAAPGTFFRALAPTVAISMRLADEPPAPWDASTVLVRFVSAAPDGENPASAGALSSGDVGVLELPPIARELLVFPESALLRSSEGPYVLVPSRDGKALLRRPVQIGRFLKGRVVLLAGLAEGEPIVVGSAFFLDERRKREPAAGAVAGVVP
jgi:hypothetical protein